MAERAHAVADPRFLPLRQAQGLCRHASGYLAGAAPGIERQKAERAQWLQESCHALKHESGAARRLADELAAQVAAGSRTRGAAPALEAASGYFAHNIERMNYAVFRAMQFPIGPSAGSGPSAAG